MESVQHGNRNNTALKQQCGWDNNTLDQILLNEILFDNNLPSINWLAHRNYCLI